MTIDSLLRFLTQAIFLFVAASTVLNWAKYRGQARFDTALVFLSLAFAILAQDLQPLFPALETVLALIFFIALLIQPYLLLRLVKYFVVIPTVLQRAALIGLFFVFASFSFIQLMAVPVVSLAVVYFLVLEGYATLLLVQGAGTLRGIIGQRLRLAAIGSGLLALIFFLALALVIIRTATRLPAEAQTWFGPLFQILAILSGLSYYFGFSPPRWLRQNWQFKELHRFLQQISKQLEHNRLTVLEELAAATLRTVGGATAIIAGWNAAEQRLVIEVPGEIPLQAESPEMETGAIGQTWQDKKPRLAHVPHEIGPETKRWSDQFGIRTLFLIPIIGSLQPRGLLMVALRYEPLFIQDDLELLTLLAGEAASSLDRFALLDELQVANQSLEQRVAERTSQLEAEMAERKQANAQNIFHARLLRHVNDAVIATDADFRITAWNRAAERMYGWTTEEAMGHNAAEIMGSGLTDAQRAEAIERLKEASTSRTERIHHRKDGQPIYVEANTIALKDENGKLTGYVTVNRDVTERKQAEDALAASERRFRALVENSSMLINLINREGVLTYVSPSSASVVGFTPKEMMGRKVVEFLHPDEVHDKERPLPNMFRSPGNVVKSERRVRHKDGTWRWVEGYSTNLLDDPAVGALVFNYRDITDRKQAEDALRTSERRSNALIEHSLIAFTLLDAQKRIIYYPPSNEQLLGYTLEERLQQTNQQLIHPDDLDTAQALLVNVYENPGMVFSAEFRMRHKNGSWIWVETTGKNLLAEPSVQAVVINSTNTSERKQAEEQNRFQANLVANVSEAIVAVDMQLNVQSWNPAAEAMYGWMAEEVIGRTAKDILETDFLEATREAATKQVIEKGSWLGEVLQRRRDGTSIPILSSLSLYKDSGGKPAGVIAVNRDITERKRAEEQLRYQAHLLENVNDAIVAADANYVIKAWNKAAEKMYGWSAEEAMGQVGAELLQTEFPGMEANAMRRQIAEVGHYYGEATQSRKDGTRIQVEIASIVVWNEAGQITDYLSVIRDITRRKQAEERFHLAVESAPNAIILADQNGNIVMVNSQTENFFGYQRSELVGLNVDQLVPERYRGIHPNHRQDFLTNPQTRAMGVGRDLYGVRKDGSEFPVEIGLTPLETQEGLLVMATVVDITERKQAEERFYLAVEAAPNAIVLVNRTGQISLVNSQAENFFGYDRAELVGLIVDQLVPERFRAKHPGYRGGFIADPQVRSMGIGRDLYGVRKDGSEFPVEIGLTPIETREGLLVMATVVDITERKLAEAKLQRQNQRLKVLREIDTSILASDSMENIVEAALSHIRELIDCQRASLTIIDWEADEAQTFDVKTANKTRVPKGSRFPLAQFQDMIQTLSRNQPIQIDDLRRLTDPPPSLQSIIDEGLRSLCVLPLFSQNNLMGAFSMSSETPGFFDEEKLNLGREVANQVAIAITQSNLLNTLRQFNAELEQRVTERTAELSEANTLLQAMLDNIPDQIYFKDLQSRFIRNSRSQAELMGVNDPAEVIGKSDFDFFPHAQRSFDEEQELMKTAQAIVDLEERVAWPDGQVTWVSTTKVPLRTLGGQTIGILGISRDITDRKRFEEDIQKLNEDLQQYAAQLQESEEKFSKAFLASPAAMSIAQATDGRYMDVNDALARMTGYSREELLGHTSLELGLVDNESRAKILQAGRESGFIRDVEIQVHTKSKQTLDVLVSLEQIVLNGQVCMLTIQYDITERKRAEAEVRRLNQELEYSQKDIQSILDSMSTLNAKVARDGTLLFVNKIATQASGLSYDELLRTNFLEGQWWTFDPQVQNRVKEAFAKACAGAAINYDEKIFVFGRVLTINFSLTPMLGNNGEVEYILAEGRDITELKQLNDELEQRRIALEVTNKELEAFSYSVSHDLRAPLRAVSGFSQALSGKYNDQLGEQGKHYLDRIQHNTRQMGQLIDDLLSLSRISRREMKQEIVKLSELVHEITAELRAQDSQREVRFEIEEQLEAQGDAGLIRIVLQNLLANAWKFTATRSETHIQFGQVHDSNDHAAEGPVYFVKDNGVGFDMAYANKLFGAFQRLHSAEEFPGTGIGLATVQRIIHRHGGWIWVEAELEKGATFYFTLGEKHES